MEDKKVEPIGGFKINTPADRVCTQLERVEKPRNGVFEDSNLQSRLAIQLDNKIRSVAIKPEEFGGLRI